MRLLERFIFYDLLLTAVLAPLAFGTVEEWSIALFELNAMILLAALTLAWQPQGQARKRWSTGAWLAVPLLGLLALNVAQAWWPGLSLDPYATKQSAVKLLALVAYFGAALFCLRDGARRWQLLQALCVFGFALALFAIAQKLTYNGRLYWVRPVSPYVAPFGPYANYNHFAGAMELLWPLAFAYWLFARTEGARRALAFFASIVMAAALVFTLSRGGWLTLAAQLLVFLLIARRSQTSLSERTPLFIVGAVVLIGLLALWLGYDQLAARVQLLRQGTAEYSVVTRWEYWRAAWQIFRAYPWTGIGLGAFPAVYPQYGRSSAKLERLETVHNDYLQLLTDGGLVAGGLLLVMFWLLLRHLRQVARSFHHLHRSDRVCLVGGALALLGIALHSVVDFNLQITANALLSLLALALVASVPSQHSSHERAF